MSGPQSDIAEHPSGLDPANGLSETLREAVGRHGERAVLLCSFQKEESVLLDELLRISDGRSPVAAKTRSA